MKRKQLLIFLVFFYALAMLFVAIKIPSVYATDQKYEYFDDHSGGDTFNIGYQTSSKNGVEAQLFTVAAASHTVTQIDVYLGYMHGTYTDGNVSIYATSGSPAQPTGGPLTIHSWTWGSIGWYNISVPSYTLSASTTYAIVVTYHQDFKADGYYVEWSGINPLDGADYGVRESSDGGGSWPTALGEKQCYEIWGNPAASSITIDSSPEGSGYVTVDGGAITTPHIYTWNIGDSHTIAANSPANLVAGQSQYLYSSWSDSGAQSHSYTVPGSDATVTATFQLQYYLTVQGGNSPSGQGWYNSGATKTVTNTWVWNSVTGQSRTALTNYYLDTTAQNPSRSNTGNYTTGTITMSTYHNVTFSSVTQYFLTATGGNPPVGYGTASPTGDNWYDTGTSTTVSSDWVWSIIASQSRTAITNYAIDGASQGPARQGTGTLTTSSVSFTTYRTVVFASTTQYYVTLATATVGTTVGQSGSQTSDNWYDSGSSASLSATTPYLNGTTNRFTFLNWTWTRGGVAQTNSSNNPFSVTMSNYLSATAYWNTDLINLFSYSIAVPRVNVATSPYINLTYEWQSDNVQVASGFTVKINGASHTISSGWTNFTDTSATVQTVTYQLTQAEGGTFYVNSVSPLETWDRVEIVSGGISDNYAHVGTSVLVNYALDYESDFSRVTDGTVLLNGTAMTYNVALTRWEQNVTSAVIASNHYSVSAVSGNLYGITVINDVVGPVGPCQWYANLNVKTVDVDANTLTGSTVYMNNGTSGIPTGLPPGTGFAIVGSSGTWTATATSGGWANYTGITNSTVYLYVKWYGLQVDTMVTLTMTGDQTTSLGCLCYPFTVSSIMFWTASNATITASNYTGNILTLSFSASLNNYTLIASCPVIPRYILNVTYNLATCFSSGYLSLNHYGNATLTLDYESWSDLYIQSTDQTLTSVAIVSGQLQIVPAGQNGTVATLQVYCGALGNPTITTGFTTGTYGSSIYSGSYVLNGQTLSLGWAVSPFIGQGGTTTGTTGPTISVNIVLIFPSRATQGQVVNGILTVTWQSYAMIFIWQVACQQPYSTWIVNFGNESLPLSLQTAQTTGNVSLPVTLTVPATTADGNYQVPCSVTFQTPTGISKTVGSTIALTIGAAQPAGGGFGVEFVVMGGFVGLFALLFLSFFVRKNRSKKGQF